MKTKREEKLVKCANCTWLVIITMDYKVDYYCGNGRILKRLSNIEEMKICLSHSGKKSIIEEGG